MTKQRPPLRLGVYPPNACSALPSFDQLEQCELTDNVTIAVDIVSKLNNISAPSSSTKKLITSDERRKREQAANYALVSVSLEGLKPSREAINRINKHVMGDIDITALIKPSKKTVANLKN